ncbi:hypothetical protein DFH09DRAFT_1192186 [Mycena vulgaris]|nr:hypothetical protein DFH09DRAFT_1192186 [Mycena vulgaris]
MLNKEVGWFTKRLAILSPIVILLVCPTSVATDNGLQGRVHALQWSHRKGNVPWLPASADSIDLQEMRHFYSNPTSLMVSPGEFSE